MPDDAQVDPRRTIEKLRRELDARTAERDEALAERAAIAEVLQVINSSPGDLVPVFDAILEKATRVCAAAFGVLLTWDGERLHRVAFRGVPAELIKALQQPMTPVPGTIADRLVHGEWVISTPDLQEEEHRGGPGAQAFLRHRARSCVHVALHKEERLLGSITVYREEVRPFTDKQITLLENFAAQAVIAIENARLLGELRERTQDLTSREGALRRSEERYALAMRAINEGVYEWDVTTGSMYYSPRVCELVGLEPSELRTLTDWTDRMHPDDRQSFRDAVVAHFKGETDWLEAEYRYRHGDGSWHWARHHGIALKNKAGRAYRVVGSTGDITDRKAAEEALREALEQQTATAEVLQVINSSPGDLAPVFDAMLEKAMRLCEAEFGLLTSFDGGAFHAAALRGVPASFAESWREPRRPGPRLALHRLTRGENLVHIPDVTAEDAYQSGDPIRRALADLGGARTGLWVALRKDSSLLGAFVIYRKEVRLFSDKQISLLQNFAAQAVIAMENARLITETREALEQQTATAEVLQVINSSPGDLAPVFDAIVTKAVSLCGATLGSLHLYDGEQFDPVAVDGERRHADHLRQQGPFQPPRGALLVRPDPQTGLGRIEHGERVVQIADLADPEDPRAGTRSRRDMVELGGIRTSLWVALRKEETLLGTFVLYRKEVRPFTEKQIALVENFAAQAVIAMENARLLTETREALEQQTATAEVLEAINSSPGDLAPVFAAMLEKATNLCGAAHGALFIKDGERFHAIPSHNTPESFAEFLTREPIHFGSGTIIARTLQERSAVQVADMRLSEPYRNRIPIALVAVEAGGTRTLLSVPMFREDALIGIFQLARQEVRSFSEKQIALVQNFAAQAVIAIENTRLITETREALEQQTATAEVLQVINSSPGDLAPVFDTMLEKAMRLCEAAFGMMHTYDGKNVHPVAMRGIPSRFAEFAADPASQPGPGGATPRLAAGARFVHVADLMEEEAYQSGEAYRRALVDLGGARTLLAVPLRKDGVMLGQIVIYRTEARPYSDKQIALLENFAAQAVIAMENARLLTETREALEQQTATAEVLQVINSSPGDLTPVFDAILDKGSKLCDAAFGTLRTYDGERFQLAASRGASVELLEFQREPLTPGPGGFRLLSGEALIHVPDIIEGAAYQAGAPARRALVELGGARSYLSVALRKEKALLGYMSFYRREVHPFSDKQIALLENFAAQAVIAMENARLLTETREALEQQTATAEVLQVINSSPGDLMPVFDEMLERALRLCEAAFGFMDTYDGEVWETVAMRQVPLKYAEYLSEQRRASPGTAHSRIEHGEHLVHIADLSAEELYRAGNPQRSRLVELAGARTFLVVSLRKDSTLLGAFSIYRREVRPFSDNQVALLESFAAQAVIAMENARLLTETREALEQQTATAEVLQVINSSPDDLAPVFDAMLEKAMRLCGADFGVMNRYDGKHFYHAADNGVPSAYARYRRERGPITYGSGTTPARLVAGENLIHTADLMATEAYERGEPARRALVDLGGARTHLTAALRKGDVLLGDLSIYRQEVRPFTDKQVALLQNFAAQAVIAIENARLLTETREALEQQTATAEVLQVINSSPGDLAPVFDAMLEKAMRLCEAAFGTLWTYDADCFRSVAQRGVPGPYADYLAHNAPPASAGTGRARILRGEPFVHVADLKDEEPYRSGDPHRRAMVDLGGARTGLIVPLRKDDAVIGFVMIYRQQVRPFSDKQIALLQNFAAQAVIAMENARLLGELRERTHDLEESLEYQTATSDVLKVISRSTFDLQPVLDTLLETAARLCGADFGGLNLREGDATRVAASFSHSPEFDAFIRGRLLPAGRGNVAGRVVLEGKVVQITDVASDPEFTITEVVTLGKIRTMLGVPLLREGVVVGAIILHRQRVEPFTERQIELVRTFADQAVIAIENTRLITETREALEQQTATAEILEVINRSPGNLAPVYEVILEKAHNLCGVSRGTLQLYDGEYLRVVAAHGADVPRAFVDRLRQGYRASDYPLSRPFLDGARFVHIADLAEIDHPLAKTFVELAGTRSVLFVPLRREGALLGVIASARQEVRPFLNKEIALLENFAAQAVIAMDNARLLEEIRQRQAELRVTFDNMGDGVAMFDGKLRLAAWNLNFQRILDLPDALLEQRPAYADYLRALAERGEFGSDGDTELSRRLAGIDQELRLEHTRPDGRVIEVRRNAVPGGGFVVIYSDITERKRAEAEIRAARDTAERALQELQTTQASLVHAQKMAALGQLTAGIAHEIKNPLNFVNNFAELSGELLLELKETTAPAVAALGADERAAVDEVVEMLRGNLDKIAEHGKRADGIVKSMLEHSRGVSGERRAVDLNALIEEALNLAYHGARAQDARFNITLEREFDRGLTPTELAPQEMTRVFLNLFGNGFYATAKRQRDGAVPEFRPTLKVATRDLGDAIEVRVRDNGTGIAPEIRDKLFQPFVTTKPTGQGTGLGLSISYDIVTQQHGGTIEVDSRLGEFTEFTIRLPRPR